MLQPHPLYTFFTEQLSLTTPKSWSGIGFRSAVPRYANARDMISSVGAFRGGGRWNTPGNGPWLEKSNPSLQGSTPLQVIERGESDRIWRIVWQLREGNVGD
jgi:hypothetical protein